MKLPYELRPGDRFYYRHSIGEEVKLWKVMATGHNSLIASSDHTYSHVPLPYDLMTDPERHYCYVPAQPGLLGKLIS